MNMNMNEYMSIKEISEFYVISEYKARKYLKDAPHVGYKKLYTHSVVQKYLGEANINVYSVAEIAKSYRISKHKARRLLDKHNIKPVMRQGKWYYNAKEVDSAFNKDPLALKEIAKLV